MGIKKIVKKIGKCFIDLKQENERIIGLSVLIVDNGYGWIGNLDYAIERINNNFPKAEISVLTSEQRRAHLKNNPTTLQFIKPSERLWPKRYQIALEMLKMNKKSYDLLVLFSLDITPLLVSLIFLKPKKIILYNRWGQWWSLKLRNVKEVFKITYIKKKERFNEKSFFKKIGLFFILVNREDERILKHSILIVDDSGSSFLQIDCAIQRIKESLPAAKISALLLEQRKELQDKFPDIEIIKAEGFIIKKYRIARHMLRLRKHRYDEVILLSLDVTPIIAYILFMDSKLLLYNQWHQWWSLTPKSIRQYLMAIPLLLLGIIINILVFLYLLINASWIFLRKSINLFRFNLSGKKV